MHSLLQQAVILDTETLGLRRGAGLHELAVYDMQRRHVRGYVLDPNAVAVQGLEQQDLAKLASGHGDQFEARNFSTWMDALHWQVEQQRGHAVPAGKTLEVLKSQSPWLHAQLRHHPHLLGASAGTTSRINNERLQRLRSMNITGELGRSTNIATLLGGELQDQLRGRTVWIANAAFESKQLGAQLGALGTSQQFKSMLETAGPSADPFYVTGSEVTKARVLAQQTGDWTHVWRAYNANPAPAGTTAVRDIQDVVKAMYSYGRKLGFINQDTKHMGTSIDVVSRLFAHAQADQQMLQLPELHRAAEDAAIHEAYVLENAVKSTDVLQQVAEGTERGRQILQQGQQGPLGTIANYFAGLEAHGPALVREQALKRLQRASLDLQRDGATFQRVGDRAIAETQLTSDGTAVNTYRSIPHRRRMNSMNQVLDFVEQEGRYSHYGVNIRNEWDSMSKMGERQLNDYVHTETQKLRASYPSSWNARGRIQQVMSAPRGRVVNELMEAGTRAVRGRAGTAVAALGLLAGVGAAYSTVQPAAQEPKSMLHYGYRDWVQRRTHDGMSHGAVASQQRKQMTDFGSPYKGPTGVENVFIDQQLMDAREKWLRSQYGATHFNPKAPLNPLGPWRWGTTGYSFIPGGEKVRGKDYGMKGDLMKIDLADGGWKVTAEDADTIVVKRGGIRGAMASFFGFNKGYSFRLAGLDAPETSHGSRSYHAPQPYAQEATAVVQQMLAASKNQVLVFDPNQTTYGRMLGGLVVDGKNLNIQLVQQGLAAHLPYGNPRDSIIDYAALEAAESRAYENRRGMWSQPWARSFYEHSAASGERVTFNTLAKVDGIVQNRGNMYMLSAMEQSQRDGAFTPAASELARSLGSQYHVGSDSVGPMAFQAPSAPHTSYLHEQMQDLSGYMKTGGTGANQNKLSSRSGYSQLDQTMVLDTLGTSDNVWTRRKYASFESYGSSKALARTRKQRMANQQRQALRLMNQSPIGHHRM